MGPPQGPSPALTRPTSFSVFRSTTETSFEGPLATYSSPPSGEIPSPHGRLPTAMVLSTLPPAGAMTQTIPARPVLTYRRLPSADMAVPIGREPVGSLMVF